ncbi:MAG: AMP-binding protein [Trueperaceae bacterium]|nr:AMP-binding protein [Trueperaceae bacterium]
MLEPKASYQELYDTFYWHIPEHYNIGLDVCDKWADREPERLALIHKSRDGFVSQYSFAQVRDLANQTANLFRSVGLNRGDRIGIFLPQTPETAYAHVAAYKMAAVAVPLFTLFGPDALEYRINNAGISAILTDKSGVEKLKGLAGRLEPLKYIFCIDSAETGIIDFHKEREKQSPEFEAVQTHAEDPAFLIFTSGTTGNPKGALHAHRSLLGHIPGVDMAYNFLPRKADRFWTPADWAWIGGLYDVLMPAWHHGISVVSHRFEKFNAEEAFKLMADFSVRNSFLPPTALKFMRVVKNPKERFAYKLRSVVSAGESLGAELLEWGKETFGLTINEFYGQTEYNIFVSSCSAIMPTKPGIIGRAAPGHTVAILDGQGKELPRGEIGQIAAKTPNPIAFLGYWQNPTATQEKYFGDWLLTGDQGSMDDEGYIKFVGRNDDLITSGGYRIGPGEIENCLLSHRAVKMAAVVGVPDPERTEIVKAFIILEEELEGSELLKRELQDYVKTRLSAHEYPRLIDFVDSFPMTTTGKIMRRELRKS